MLFAGSKIQAQKGCNAVTLKENRSPFASQSLIIYSNISKVNLAVLKRSKPLQKKNEDDIIGTRLLIAERQQNKTMQKNID